MKIMMLALTMVLLFALVPACERDCGTGHEEVEHAEASGHSAVHGGVLNVIGNEIAHMEIKVEGKLVRCWFVGGGNDTDKSVRIPADEFTLDVKLHKGKKEKLVFRPKPIELASEKVGDCSYFEAEADWVEREKQFEGTGKTVVKGVEMDLTVKHPKGWGHGKGECDHEDCGHEGREHGDHEEE